MKAVILAGGLGTRLREETTIKPKPMVEIGGKPILWHIMKIYSHYGINEFIICLGYKGYVIKEYFANYFLHMSDITFDINKNKISIHQNQSEPWKVTLIDTGHDSQTGGRIKRIKNHISEGETFCMTYGDGVSNVNISELINKHKSNQMLATVTAVQPPGRFGSLKLDETNVTSFKEKPEGDGAWINGGFFVLEPEIFDYIEDDQSIWEEDPMKLLAQNNQLGYFKHDGFWQPMDTLKEHQNLDALWKNNSAPWKVWNNSENEYKNENSKPYAHNKNSTTETV